MINTFVHLMIQNKKMFRLSNTARKIFWVARIFDATLPNFTNGRAIAPPAPLSPTPMAVSIMLYNLIIMLRVYPKILIFKVLSLSDLYKGNQ